MIYRSAKIYTEPNPRTLDCIRDGPGVKSYLYSSCNWMVFSL